MNCICLAFLIAVASPVECTVEHLCTVVIAVSFQKLHLRGTCWGVCVYVSHPVWLESLSSNVLYICKLKTMAVAGFVQYSIVKKYHKILQKTFYVCLMWKTCIDKREIQQCTLWHTLPLSFCSIKDTENSNRWKHQVCLAWLGERSTY